MKVVEACALIPDLKILPAGDLTGVWRQLDYIQLLPEINR